MVRMFGLKFKEPFCEKKYTCIDEEGFNRITYQRKIDPVKEVFGFGLFGFFICMIIDAILIKLSIDTIYYFILFLLLMIIRLYTIVEGEVRTIPNKDGTGPREDSTGPRDGRGGGKGRGTGAGAGSKTGGEKGDCE